MRSKIAICIFVRFFSQSISCKEKATLKYELLLFAVSKSFIAKISNEYKESVDTHSIFLYSWSMGKPISHKHVLLKFGQQMQKVRQSKGVTQEELAGKLAMHRTYIGLIERGERNPTIRTLYKIAKALKVDSSELLPF